MLARFFLAVLALVLNLWFVLVFAYALYIRPDWSEDFFSQSFHYIYALELVAIVLAAFYSLRMKKLMAEESFLEKHLPLIIASPIILSVYFLLPDKGPVYYLVASLAIKLTALPGTKKEERQEQIQITARALSFLISLFLGMFLIGFFERQYLGELGPEISHGEAAGGLVWLLTYHLLYASIIFATVFSKHALA